MFVILELYLIVFHLGKDWGGCNVPGVFFVFFCSGLSMFKIDFKFGLWLKG